METVTEYLVIPVGKKSVVQLIAEQRKCRASEVIAEAAKDLKCPHNQYIWISHFIDCNELPARVILWGIDKLFPAKEAV